MVALVKTKKIVIVKVVHCFQKKANDCEKKSLKNVASIKEWLLLRKTGIITPATYGALVSYDRCIQLLSFDVCKDDFFTS